MLEVKTNRISRVWFLFFNNFKIAIDSIIPALLAAQQAVSDAVASVEALELDVVNIDAALTDLDTTKQDVLVSGTNIKTLNGASLLGSGNISNDWTYVILGADAANSAVAPIDTALVITLDPNSLYEIEGKLFIESSVATTGAKPGVKMPTSGVTKGAFWITVPTTVTAFVSRNGTNNDNTSTAGTAMPVINTPYLSIVSALIKTGTPVVGDFKITIGSEIAASQVKIVKDSFIKYRKIP